MKAKTFGALPTGNHLARITASPQYKAGKFTNQSFTPDLADGATMWKILKAFLSKPKTVRPTQPVPSVTPGFSGLPEGEPAIIWFGHSSYYLQFEGLKILVDPVFSNSASPIPGMIKAFAGTDIVKLEDFPALDYIIISHDHYDHLDYKTILALKSKTAQLITSLGVGAHLERWGIAEAKITELDWWESVSLKNDCTLIAAPARHFSGRGIKRAQSLWSSFILKSPRYNYYLGGDSGWDNHFEEIGNRFGPFDLAILECGQYHPYWKNIHMMPEEVAEAAEKLGAKKLLPVHWAKFTLALHPWTEPIERLLKAAAGKPFAVLTPMIGATLLPQHPPDNFEKWWR